AGEYPVHLFAANGFVVLYYDAPNDWALRARANGPMEELLGLWDANLFEVTASPPLFDSAIDLLERRGVVDGSRVGITGFSTGMAHASHALLRSARYRA